MLPPYARSWSIDVPHNLSRLIPPRVPLILRAALLAVLILPRLGAAQATIRGRVVDSETGAPLVGATVTLRRAPTPFTTDSAGQFFARDLPAGDVQITVQLLGYAMADFRMRVPNAGEVEKVFSLDFTGQLLPTVAVSARAEQLMARYADFERRRHRGAGAFLRWDDLAKESFGSVGDALRTVRGVRIKCNQQTFECLAYMSRSMNCQPVWYIDGMEARSFHESTPIRDVYGIEIYRGPGETPGEFSGSNAACGAIIVWTKSRPYRSTP